MSKNTTITVRGAVALGVGSMVGAGIFSLMGEAARMAGSAVWAAFLGAGIVALLTGYSFVMSNSHKYFNLQVDHRQCTHL
jgi:amino acid transporter